MSFLRHPGLLLASLVAVLLPAPSIVPPASEIDLAHAPTVLENKHVRVVRIKLGAHQSARIQAPATTGVLVSLSPVVARIQTGAGAPVEWNSDSGGAVILAHGAVESIENAGGQPAEFFAMIEMDPSVHGRVSVPPSSLDPVAVDPEHFRVVMEDHHFRVLLLQLGPGEATRRAQFTRGVLIPLSDGITTDTTALGATRDATLRSGEPAWVNDGLHSTRNSGDKPFRYLLVSWKIPFCYQLAPGLDEPSDEELNYARDVAINLRYNWLRSLPYEAKLGNPGLVEVDLKIQRDGIVRGQDIVLTRVYSSETLASAAVSAVRTTAPFEPFGSAFASSQLEFRVVFLYNLPPNPAGCD